MPAYIIKPVDKALLVIERLAEAQKPLTLKEVCYAVGLPKTTTYKYLCTLAARGYVSRDPATETYQLGLRLWQLGQAVGHHLDVRAIAQPHMHELRDRFNETVNLGILDGHEIIYVAMEESSFSLRMQATLGGRDPAYSTALGKAMLAHLPGDSWRAHLPSRLTRRTERTVTSIADLRKELDRAREVGYALDRGENEPGVSCVGAPIFDHDGQVVAALSVSAPDIRVGPKRIPEVAAAVKKAAAAVSAKLAHR